MHRTLSAVWLRLGGEGACATAADTLAPVTSPQALKRPLHEMPCSPSRIHVDYELEATLGNDSHEDTLEKWRLVAHLGEGFGLEDFPACEECTARWDRIEERGGFVAEVDECVHRLQVGVLELVKVRWGGSQNPFWAMEEESQNLYEIAQTIFNQERTGFTEEFEELAEWGGSDVLVLDKAEIVDSWRGFGLGPMLAADAFRRLAPGCGAVMVHPAPIDSRGMTAAERNRACTRLRETWATLGFVPYSDTPYMIFATCWADPEEKQYTLRKASRDLYAAWQSARSGG
ncbi:hypothetical protein GCM10023082_06810 [Streptomyces tremellae]|uniref:N-acetyltransferase domain-containing protein n=1 Tax=Streptomyces tremellae TaxID=1124239 RepID=A0ABP7DY77_9ACTN